jgi:CheY-like chemotaxis protein
LVFEVEDEGIGIPDHRMNQLFAPFNQTQRLAGGTGLGLFSLAKRIEALQGKYGVQKRKDEKKGSLFWFAIPYRPDVMVANLHHQQIQRQKKHRHRRNKGTLAGSANLGQFGAIAGGESVNGLGLGCSLKLELGHCNSLDEYCATFNNTTSTGSGRVTTPTAAAAAANNYNNNGNAAKLILRQSLHNLHQQRSNSNMVLVSGIPLTQQSLSKLPISAQSSSSSLSSDMEMDKPKEQHTTIESSPSPQSQDQLSQQRLEILLVEDSPMISKMVSMMLSRQHHQVTVAENGEIAIKRVMSRLEKTSAPFDVILMDLQMPVMDGLEATKRLRALEQEYPPKFMKKGDGTTPVPLRIIGLSANSDSDTMQEAYEAGIDCFIPKPFNFASFNNALSNIDVHQQQNQLQRK